ncbi:hypothetical protein [Anaeromyxobacter dehalogenans]|uniref:Outer membrane protein beta-barrel domain-containing protein n=1 Tax=Anaeromyxobacter dehalogenans (strain 2CP-C) TaxID=290397 RepID=Q2IK83_ANADE|nr:hypothetical protein [Anaeromyxobacter dehalogenans]ABC82060.1 hypothetical protein Adeh_2290 [Anaeromyxobacter dehalogenans 2CP-C]
MRPARPAAARRRSVIPALLLVALLPAAARGAEPEAAPAAGAAGVPGTTAADAAGRGQRSFGVGPTLGFWSGAGLLAGGGTGRVKGWVSGGYAPVMVFSNERTPGRDLRFDFYNAYQVNAEVSLRVNGPSTTEIALLAGYKYNGVLGHGAGGGLRVLFDVGPRAAVELSFGLAVFPEAMDRLERDHAYPSDRDPGLTPSLQGGANLGLLVFP